MKDMKQLLSLILLTCILGARTMNAQQSGNDYLLDKKVFIFDIVTFDSLVTVKTETSESIICIEKSNLLQYADKDIAFYLYWELFPNSYKLMLPDIADGFMKQFVLPVIEDSLLLSQVMKNYSQNGLPKLNSYNLLLDNPRFSFHNLKCQNIKCFTFLVLLVPYTLWNNYIDNHVDYEPINNSVVSKQVLSELPFSKGLYIKMLYPLPFFED
ncbi:MAG: hypothetical protein IKN78_02565 [Bacteroidales bacterium]|nr:hypothetical protein [Bacteroidales bacterium]